MISKYITPVLALAMILGVSSCGNQTGSEASAEEEEEEVGMVDVVLTDKQVQQLGITTGQPEQYMFASGIEVKGQVEASPQSVAKVTPFVGANVKSISVHEGQSVSRGQVLAVLSHPDLIELQGRYLTAVNRLTFVEQELQRQKTLVAGNAGSGRDLQQAQSEQRTLRTEISTIGQQLRMLGISPESVKAGKTTTQITVTSPISGTVEEVLVSTGQFADPQSPMFRIVNSDNVFADFMVYEKDLPRVAVGQSVSLSPQSDPTRVIQAKVYSVGKDVDPQTKAVHVRASFTGDSRHLVSGMYLKGKIASGQQTSPSVPSEGIIDEEGSSYIFTMTRKNGKCVFHPVRITKGREENGRVELALDAPLTSPVVLTGAYYIISEMKKSETGEEYGLFQDNKSTSQRVYETPMVRLFGFLR
ncbi:MAG: efflux RND transporter periplasmic adaptor subunit [Bacteroidales bacterium]|nr:efflux RND transporter periplasmic adaptor subunit [Bacteroidales bacterium]